MKPMKSDFVSFMTKVAVFAVALAAVQAQGAYRDLSAADYVQGGLINQWDGSANVGLVNGVDLHDATVTTWKDLKGNLDMSKFQNYYSWAANGKALTVSRASMGNDLPTSAYRTIEVLYAMTTAGGNVLFNSGTYDGNRVARLVAFGSSGTTIYGDARNRATLYAPTVFEEGVVKSVSFLYGDDDAVSAVATNGLLVASPGSQTFNVFPNRKSLGVGGTSGSYCAWSGDIYSIRLYDVELSPADLARNALVDRLRAVSAPGTARVDTDTGTIELKMSAEALSHGSVAFSGGTPCVSTSHWAAVDAEVVLTAVPETGAVFLKWIGDTDGLSEASLASTTLRFAADRPRSLRAQFDANDCYYSKDGLVAHFDAIDNAGAGQHDPAATTWKDLSPNAYDLGAYADCELPTWTADGALFPPSRNGALACLRETPFFTDNTHLTVEIVADGLTETVSSSGNAGAIFGLYAATTPQSEVKNYPVFRSSWYNNLNLTLPGPTTYGPNVFQHCSLRQSRGQLFHALSRDGGNYSFYYGGELVETKTDAGSTVREPKAMVMGRVDLSASSRNWDYSYGFTSVVHAVRVYSRTLSKGELVRHAYIDRRRFLSGEYANWMRRTATGPELRTRVTAVGGGTVRIGDGTPGAAAETWSAVNGAGQVLTAIPAAGYVFRYWSGEVGDVEPADRVLTTLTLGGVSAREVTAVFARADAPTAASYPTAGLLVQFDGEENVGLGWHADQTRSLTDLSGNGHTATACATRAPEFVGNRMSSWRPSDYGAYFAVPTDAQLLSAVNSTAWTVQYCGRTLGNHNTSVFGNDYTFSVIPVVHSSPKKNRVDVYYRKQKHQSDSWDGDILTNDTVVTVSFDGARFRVYAGETLMGTANAKSTGYTDVTDSSFAFVSKSDSGKLYGPYEIFALRVYDRVLTGYDFLKTIRNDEERFLGSNVTYIAAVESSGAEYGSATLYGASRHAPGWAGFGFDVSPSLTTYGDGARAVAVSDTVRARYTGYRLERSGGTTEHAGESYALAALDGDVRATLLWTVDNRLYVTAAPGGKVSADGGAAASSVDVWASCSDVVELTAIPEAEYAFAGWTGDLPTGVDPLATEIAVTMEAGRSIQALFVSTHHDPTDTAWIGGASGNWNDHSNWSAGEIPGAGDRVTVEGGANGVAIALPGRTAELASLTLSNATVTVSGWSSAIRAGTVELRDGTILTCETCDEANVQPTSRVHVVATDLTIAAGAKIDVSGKGWQGRMTAGGQGPGGGVVDGGGAYGGAPGSHLGGDEANAPRPYGSVMSPREPGSAGGSTADAAGGAGGGAVLVEATGVVTVDGEILANGVDETVQNTGGGSGGSIDIGCAALAGKGLVAAKGGSGYHLTGDSQGSIEAWGGDGSGGRIAIRCTALSARPSVRFDARAGFFGGERRSTCHYLRSNGENDGECGTVYFGSGLLFTGNPCNVFGQLHTADATLVCPSIAMTGGWLAFTQNGFRLHVTGDVTLGSAKPRSN